MRKSVSGSSRLLGLSKKPLRPGRGGAPGVERAALTLTGRLKRDRLQGVENRRT